MSRKNSLHVRSVCFWGFVLFLFGFPSSSPFCFVLFCFVLLFFKRENSGLTGHTPHAPCVLVPFSCLCPRHTGFISRFGRVSCWGAILGPGRFGVSWILSVLWGARDYSPPSEALFSDARRQGCLLSILLLPCVVFPLLCCLRLHCLLSPSRCSTPKWANDG